MRSPPQIHHLEQQVRPLGGEPRAQLCHLGKERNIIGREFRERCLTPLDGVEVRAVEGELHVRGPMLLRTYRDGTDPKDPTGWLPTGDGGTVTGGVVGVVGGAVVVVAAVDHRRPQVARGVVRGLDPHAAPDPDRGIRDDVFGHVVDRFGVSWLVNIAGEVKQD